MTINLLEQLPPIYRNFEVGIGETFNYSFVLKSPDNSIVDLTGCSVMTKFSDTILYKIANVLTSSIADYSNGIISFSMTSEETALLDVDRYIYSCFLITPLGKHVKILGGILIMYDTYN